MCSSDLTIYAYLTLPLPDSSLQMLQRYTQAVHTPNRSVCEEKQLLGKRQKYDLTEMIAPHYLLAWLVEGNTIKKNMTRIHSLNTIYGLEK